MHRGRRHELRRWRRAAALGIVLAGMMFLSAATAFALDEELELSQYAHTAWKVREGFTKGAITSIAQTPDGYLWLGTDLGLLRFDGVRAVPWQPPADERLPDHFIDDLLVARDGTLWISTEKGLASWKDGKLTQYPEVAGQPILPLLEDREGTVWLGLFSPGRLCAVRDGKIQCYGAGTFGRGVDALYEDHKGNLWVSAATGLWRWASAPAEHYTLPPLVNPRALIEIEGGSLLVGTSDGLKLLSNGKIQSYAVKGITGALTAVHFLRRRDGSLWIGSQQGLLRLNRGESDSFAAADGLSSDYVTGVLEDREGNVWVATSGGLDRFREYMFPTISVNQGLSSSTNWSVQATMDGSIWIGTPDGLDRWKDGQVRVYGRRSVSGEIGRGIKPGRSGKRLVKVVANSGLPEGHSLGLDDRGRLLVSTKDHVFAFDGTRFTPVPGVPGGNVFATDVARRSVWISSYDLGLFLLTPRNTAERIPWSQLGQAGWARALAADPLQGGVWLGFFDGGVAYFKDGKVRAAYTVADGLGRGRVNHLRMDADGVLWASTEGGLSRLKDGRVSTLTRKNGLPCDEVHWAIEDNDHGFWLYMPCGLVRIARSELDGWASDAKRTIETRVFDAHDGARTVGVYGTAGPRVTKTADGKIWFVPFEGLVVIDPHRVALNSLAPPVQIEQVTADGKVYDVASTGNGRMRLPPLVRDLAIDYTALSLGVPEKVHFRFKLEGQDKDWREVVNDRRIEYSNLAPKNYRFRVKACNNSGVWNEEGAVLNFAIAPAYYQTNWFRALCVAVLIALLWMVYRLRIRQLHRQEKKLRDVVETIPTFVWTALPDGFVDFVNGHWQEYTGLSMEESVGSGWEAAVHPADLRRDVEKWHASLTTGEPFEIEARWRAADGRYRWFLVRAVPLRDARGKIIKWYGTSTDIEDRKRAEVERETLRTDLAHVNRVSMLGELAASLSHELKQPIAATMINANTCMRWLKQAKPNLEEAYEATRRIAEDGKRAGDIIERIRSLYKKSPPKRELVEVNEIAREMAMLLRSEANRYAVSMRTDLAADLPKITADRVQLQQVFMNLMLNGIEAMKETGGVLTVKSQIGQDGRLLISINDTGVGLPADKADQIFEAFFTTKPLGSGMGLTISRTIVESHGGRLWATANDGRGTTFHFTLPTAAEALQASAGGT